MELLVENENGEQIKLSQIKNIDNVYLFQNNFERGTYHISGVYAFYDGQSCYFSAKDLEINAYFSVGEVCEEQKSKHIEMQSAIENENSEDAIETSVIAIDENGDTSTQDSIAEAMEEIGVENSRLNQKDVLIKEWNFKMNSKNKVVGQEKRVAIFILILGLIMSILVPTGQTPDEYSHLNMIGNSVGLEKFASNIMKSIELETEDIAYNYDKKINIEEQKNVLTEKPIYSRKEMLPKKITVAVIKHLPATIGIYIGIIFGLPAFWVLQLGELFALLFYSYICYKALQIMPIKKNMMAWFMIFPMALQQAASINYDAVLIPLCYLFISYMLYLKYEKHI